MPLSILGAHDTVAGYADSNGLMEGIDLLGDAVSTHRHWEAALLDANGALEMDEGYLKVGDGRQI